MSGLAETVVELLDALPRTWIVVIIAAMPILELRGAIPIGVLLGLPVWETFLLAMAGNLIPIPFLLFLLGPVRRMANRWPLVGPLLRWVEARALARRGHLDRYGFWGLITFVGIPLPVTGAWTGAILAVLLELPPWRSLLAIVLGVLMAGCIIGTLSAAGLWALT